MSKEDIAAKMKPLVLKYRGSDQSRKAFAAAHGISEAKLIYWIKKLSKVGSKPEKVPSSNFVPLKPGPLASSSGDHLLIRLPGGVEIQIPL